jgi:hypothetical protein
VFELLSVNVRLHNECNGIKIKANPVYVQAKHSMGKKVRAKSPKRRHENKTTMQKGM